MPRVARQKAENCTYHIIQRGNERRKLFKDDRDHIRFFEILREVMDKYSFSIYCYCLMVNHTHLVLTTKGADISDVMKSINIRYAQYFNRKYQRIGHLYQDRFKSRVVLDETYLLVLSRYIHNNPVMAGLVDKPDDFPWSSYGAYIGAAKDLYGILDCSVILKLFSSDFEVARKKYSKFVRNESSEPSEDSDFMVAFDSHDPDHENRAIHTPEDALEWLERFARKSKVELREILDSETDYKDLRRKAMVGVKTLSTLRLREVADIFGISPSGVSRAIKRESNGDGSV